MNNEDYKIHIIGAGVSGLIAATVLEENGFNPIILEATDGVGGRVKTDLYNGYQLDHGFQVLLTDYPAAKKYLDYDELQLQHFLPGSVIFKGGEQKTIGDPMRETSLLLPTLFSGIGNVADKIKVLKLNAYLKKKSLEEIFNTKEQTTLSYLKDYGFSVRMIHDFFKPFFSGIFLEEKLETSSRMFEFVYKMFGEGYASIPKAGIDAIPKQLASKLKKTTFRFNTKATAVEDGSISLADNNNLPSDFTLIAADASHLVAGLKDQRTEWKSCQTLYFETEIRTVRKPLIGLIPDEDAVINNICYPTSLSTNSKPAKQLLSVTVVNDKGLSESKLKERVVEELKSICGVRKPKFLRSYAIPQALPNLTDLQYEMAPSETKLSDTIFLAGDTLLNGSLNAAMIAGEKAALGVIERLKPTMS